MKSTTKFIPILLVLLGDVNKSCNDDNFFTCGDYVKFTSTSMTRIIIF